MYGRCGAAAPAPRAVIVSLPHGSVAVMERFSEPILHVDMDAFFVEVERRCDPSLVGRPVIVGGLGPRGVVASASYEARRHGVRSAMPMVEARRRCPGGSFVPPHHERYTETSHAVFTVFLSVTPEVEKLSVDEAFLDVSGLRRHHSDPVSVATEIRRRIRSELSLPASVGVAPNKFIAKMASVDAKPDGIAVVRAGSETAYLHPLPVRRLWGVGEATHAALEGIGVATIGDLAALSPGSLEAHVGRSLAAHLRRLAAGIDDRTVSTDSAAKSISVEETYDADLTSDPVIETSLVELSERLGARLRRSQHSCHTLTLKVRFGDFTTVTRSLTAQSPIGLGSEIRSTAMRLWERVDRNERGIRLLGIGASSLVPRDQPTQLSFGVTPGSDAADTPNAGSTARRPAPEVSAASVAGEAIDAIRDRFGDGALVPARLVGRPRDDGGGAGSRTEGAGEPRGDVEDGKTPPPAQGR